MFGAVVTGALLMTCVAMAAPPAEREAGHKLPGRALLGKPVTPISIDVDLRNLPVTKPWRPGQPLKNAPKRQFRPLTGPLPHAPASKPTASDRLPELQKIWDSSDVGRRAKVRAKATGANRVSIDNPNPGYTVGDPVVEVGANHVIYAVNATTFTVYNKSGTKLSGPTQIGSLAPSGNACSTDSGDPLIHYDRQAGRWFMLTMDSAGLCVFISKTSDPVTGGWWLYNVNAISGSMPDYPHCSVWNNAYVCGTNETNAANMPVYILDRERMLTGATMRSPQVLRSIPQLSGYGFQMITPSTLYGNSAPTSKQIVARHRDDEAHDGASANGSADYLELFELNVDWTTPANTSITALPKIAIAEFNSWFRDYSTFDTVPQPSSTARLDALREVLLNQLVYRNMGTHEAIIGTFATNQNAARSGTVVDSGVRWFELRRSGGGGWALHQEGTFSPGDSNTHHLLGTVAMDKFGNIGMGYNVTKTTAPTKFASLEYTGRTPSDPLGVMSLGENVVAAGGGVNTSGRWGDYYQMTVDPVDDCTFWFVGQYSPSGGDWKTRIADFKFPACGGGGGNVAPVANFTSTTSGLTATFTDSSTDSDGSIASRSWDFGDGSTSTAANPSRTYAAAGTYNVKLTVTDNGGLTNTKTTAVTVASSANAAPVANFTSTTSGLTVTFTNTSTDSDGTIASRTWDFGDGTSSTVSSPSKTYAAAGTYNVKLTVTDNGGLTNTKTVAVTVSSSTCGGRVLCSGTAVALPSGTSGAFSQSYTLVVPAGKTSVVFALSGGTGDADMYVNLGSALTTEVTAAVKTSTRCVPWKLGNDETCTFTAPTAGTYYVTVHAYSAYSGVSLKGTISP